MNCPYCNKEMEKGYIQSRDGIKWTRKKHLMPIFNGIFEGTVDLAEEGYSAIAYNCEDCKKVIVPYENSDE